jgi:hypothetical protein
MRLYERLGVSLESDIALPSRLELLDVALEGGRAVDVSKGSLIGCREQVALAQYLLEDQAEARAHAEALVSHVDDYLFCPWRYGYATTRAVIDKTTETGTRVLNVTLDDAACRREFMWMSYFRAGLVWALWLGQDVDVLTLAKYPADDAADEARGGGDFGPPEKAYFILLSDLILGRNGPTADAAVIEKGRRKKTKLLLAALEALRCRDAALFTAALTKCIRHHVANELPNRGLDNKLAIDASILSHVGRRMGVTAKVEPPLADHLIR